ncbi:right-handed parallel beta-helix repeat-containing protein [Thermogutta sp.]|uniref:right-handed parallel beta-helix repeat-containing protein n=1 Tax=Thermogutta sp. TaxID=1962930 RepID=UPI0032205266
MKNNRLSNRTRRLAFEPLEHRDLLSAVPATTSMPATFTDLGSVEFRQVVQPAPAPGTWYRLSAQNTATLTVIRGFQTPNHQSSASVAVYAQAGQSLVLAAEGIGRIDLPVTAGQSFFVYLPNVQTGETLWLAALVQMSGTTVTIRGTSGADTLAYRGGGTGSIAVNQIEYTLPGGWIVLAIDGRNGGDRVVVETAAVNESISISPAFTRILSGGRTITITQVADLDVRASSSAVAEITDSPGNDRVSFAPNAATFDSPQFHAALTGPSIIHAYSRNGGTDSVTFYDSPGADRATYLGDNAILQGDTFYNRAKFFSSVMFVATTGEDTAFLSGSSGTDTLGGQLGDVTLQTKGVSVRAKGFWTTIVRSSGGVDVAEVNDSPSDDFVFSFPGDVAVFNQTHTLRIQGFAYTHVYGRNGGFDTAYFYDSPGDDTFVGRPDFSTMTTGPYFTRVKFFDGVYAYSRNGGSDVAWLYDSRGDDLLTARPYYTRLEGPGYALRVETFSMVRATAGSGGNDRLEMYSSRGQDQITITPTLSDIVFSETPSSVRARQFLREAYFLDKSDQVFGTATRATIRREGPTTIINAADYYDPTSPTLGFQRAIDALPEEGGTVILPAGTFTLRQSLVLRSNVTLRGSDAGTTLVRKTQTFAFLTAPAQAGDQRVSVTSTSGFQVGDEIALVSRTEFDGQLYTIIAIEPGVLVLDRPIEYGIFQPENSAEVTNLIPLVRAAGTAGQPVANVTIENLTINGNLNAKYTRWRALPRGMVDLTYAVNSTVRNVTVTRSPTSGIALQYGHDNLVENSTVIEARNIGIALGWETDAIVRGNLVRGAGYGMASTGWGEGILVNGGRDIRVENNIAEYNVGHGLHPAGDLTIGGLWINNISRYNQGNGFHYCFNNFGVWAVNNELYGNDRGVGGLGLGGEYADRFNVVQGNIIYNNSRGGIQVNGGRDNYILANTLRNNSQKAPGRFPEILLGEVWTTVIADNRITPAVGGPSVDTTYARLFNTIIP